MKKIEYKVGDTVNNGVGDVARIMRILDNDEYLVLINACNRSKKVTHTQLVRGTFVTKRGSKYDVGKKYETLQGRKFIITEILDTNRRKVKFFDDGTDAIVYTSYMNTGVKSTRGKFTLGSKHKNREGHKYIITEIIDLYRRRIKFIKSKNERIVFTSAMYCGSIDDKEYVPKASKCGMEKVSNVNIHKTEKPTVRSIEDKREDMLSLDVRTCIEGSHNLNNSGDEYVIEAISGRTAYVHFLRSKVTKWVDVASVYKGSIKNGHITRYNVGSKHKYDDRKCVIIAILENRNYVVRFNDDNSKLTLSSHQIRKGNSKTTRHALRCGEVLRTTQCGTILVLGKADKPHRYNVLFTNSGVEKEAYSSAIRRGTVSDKRELKQRMLENDA